MPASRPSRLPNWSAKAKRTRLRSAGCSWLTRTCPPESARTARTTSYAPSASTAEMIPATLTIRRLGKASRVRATSRPLQRAHDLADRLGGDAGIECRGIKLGHLDDADIDVLLEQVGGEAMPQGVQRDALVDLRHLGSGVAGSIELARGHRLRRIAAREQPALLPRRLPPGAQQVEQTRRQHDGTVLAAFALLDADDHALAVDVGDLERDHLGGAQAGAVGHAQRCLVLQPRRGIEQPRHFLDAEDDRQLAWLVNDMGMLDDLAAPERDLKKEPQRRDGLIEGRHADAARRQMQLVAAHVLEGRRIRRSPNKRSEVLDPLHVVMLGLGRELADRHAFDHAPAQRTYCLLGHGDAPV